VTSRRTRASNCGWQWARCSTRGITIGAITYRKINNIPGDWGTAVTVQSMVFGNLGDDCATGVAFTRDPGTGEKGIYGEYLPNAQGRGRRRRNPHRAADQSESGARVGPRRAGIGEAERAAQYPTLEENLSRRLQNNCCKSRRGSKSIFENTQDMEFTIERNRLFMLQTRNGKRTAQAAVRIAVDMADEKLIDRKTALKRVEPEQLEQFFASAGWTRPVKKHVIATRGCRRRRARSMAKSCFRRMKRWPSRRPDAK